MNFCTKCLSYYQQPGTCNCYVPVIGTAPGDKPWVPQEDTTATPYVRPSQTGDRIGINPYPTTCAPTIISGTHSGVSSGTVYYDPDDPNNPDWWYT